MVYRLVSLENSPGVQPLGIGGIIYWILAKCVMLVTGDMATDIWGDLKLFSILV